MSRRPAPNRRARPVSSLLALALAATVALAGDPVAPQASPDPKVAEAAAAKAAEVARRKAEFDGASAELVRATAAFQTEIAELQKNGVAREKWPPHPNAAWYPRFEALAMQDQPDALRWCLGALGQIGMPVAEIAERKADIYARLVVVHPDLPWMTDAARWIQAEGSPSGIGFERADELLKVLVEATSVRATRVAAIAARSTLYEPRNDPASRAEHARLVRVLADEFPDTPAGASAKGRLFKTEHLVPGKVPPDVEGVDTEDRPFRLSDYRGKVVVLDFWGFWCPVCVQSLPHLRELARRHADDPFALVGVATDRDRTEFRRRAAAENVTWRNVWTGGTQGAWPTAWGVQRYPTVYVLDATGAIRFVDVRGPDLDRAVAALIAEQRAQKVPSPR